MQANTHTVTTVCMPWNTTHTDIAQIKFRLTDTLTNIHLHTL